MIVETSALKLHVANGYVWALRGTAQATATSCRLKQVLAGDLVRSDDTVQLVGSVRNAELIVQLYDRKARGELRSLQLVTPLVCPVAADRKRPLSVLYHMQRFCKAPSLGGYHEVTAKDIVSYQLLTLIQSKEHKDDVQSITYLLAMHPAWRHLSFVKDLDYIKCATLLAYIRDPRWYVDLCHPDRGSKLEAFLGLTPKTQAGITWPEFGRDRHYDRCKLVYDCWHTPAMAAATATTFSKHGICVTGNTTDYGNRPCDFVWRARAKYAGVQPDAFNAQLVKADLRASQKFISFIRLTWLAELYREHDYERGEGLFRSADFFLHVAESEAYNQYILRH